MMSRLILAFQKIKFNESALNRINDLSNKVIKNNFNEKKRKLILINLLILKNVTFYYQKKNKKKLFLKI